jgi:hypothetical protein
MDILLRLGDFRFSIETAAYQTLKRKSEHRWPAQDRLWNHPAIQYTGADTETIDLQGRVIPTYRGGLGQINTLRAMAEAPVGQIDPQPYALVTGYGEYLGEWSILGVDEDQANIMTRGAPGEQAFSIKLQRYRRDRG